jgi:hypothetical protein
MLEGEIQNLEAPKLDFITAARLVH